MLRILVAFLLAVVATYLLAAAFSTQVILYQVADLGLPISLSVRLDTTLEDLRGMLPMYLPIVAASLFVAIPVSALALHRSLGISYNAAWRMKRKLMRAVNDKDRPLRLDTCAKTATETPSDR